MTPRRIVSAARRAVGICLWHLGFAEPDRTPPQAASITYVERTAAIAVSVELDDRNEGVR